MRLEAPRWIWVGVALAVFAGCQKRTDELRRWQATDHDQPPAPSPAQVPAVDTSEVATTLQKHGISDVALLAWKKRCVTCHGLLGRGDGPDGPSTGARDLSDPLWQKNITDEQIARSIANGKGAMPRFDLPESTVSALVQFVRLVGQGTSRPAAGAAPLTSTSSATGSGPAASSKSRSAGPAASVDLMAPKNVNPTSPSPRR